MNVHGGGAHVHTSDHMSSGASIILQYKGPSQPVHALVMSNATTQVQMSIQHHHAVGAYQVITCNYTTGEASLFHSRGMQPLSGHMTHLLSNTAPVAQVTGTSTDSPTLLSKVPESGIALPMTATHNQVQPWIVPSLMVHQHWMVIRVQHQHWMEIYTLSLTCHPVTR